MTLARSLTGASGSLNFMDATNNTLFSLVPQQMIGAGQTRTLLFTAEDEITGEDVLPGFAAQVASRPEAVARHC